MNGKFVLKGCPSGVTLWMPKNAKKKKKTSILYKSKTIS